uniref:G-protein coupled receptors family 1 profile domain-containing protein n=1 Tax=Parascaris univalens TaxID=6257 RepID=A0A915AGA8_PARUN
MTFILSTNTLSIGERQISHRKKATKMLIMVVVLFALCYFPVHLHNISSAFDFDPLAGFYTDRIILALRKFVPRFMSYSSCCVNPILYNFMCGETNSV